MMHTAGSRLQDGVRGFEGYSVDARSSNAGTAEKIEDVRVKLGESCAY